MGVKSPRAFYLWSLLHAFFFQTALAGNEKSALTNREWVQGPHTLILDEWHMPVATGVHVLLKSLENSLLAPYRAILTVTHPYVGCPTSVSSLYAPSSDSAPRSILPVKTLLSIEEDGGHFICLYTPGAGYPDQSLAEPIGPQNLSTPLEAEVRLMGIHLSGLKNEQIPVQVETQNADMTINTSPEDTPDTLDHLWRTVPHPASAPVFLRGGPQILGFFVSTQLASSLPSHLKESADTASFAPKFVTMASIGRVLEKRSLTFAIAPHQKPPHT